MQRIDICTTCFGPIFAYVPQPLENLFGILERDRGVMESRPMIVIDINIALSRKIKSLYVIGPCSYIEFLFLPFFYLYSTMDQHVPLYIV
jgi:hypothetical protein